MNLKKLFVFIPMILPIWEKMPFDNVNTEVPVAPFYADAAAIRLQTDYYSKAKDARIHSKIAISLALSNNLAAIETLEGLLQNEKNPPCPGRYTFISLQYENRRRLQKGFTSERAF
jgi:hypothetical protein